jgi:hypothetical protein
LGNPLGLASSIYNGIQIPWLIVQHSLTSDTGVDNRIRPASAAFGALKNIKTKEHTDLKGKKALTQRFA